MTSFSRATGRVEKLCLQVLPLAALLLVTGCGRLGDALTGHTDVVARANGKELLVEQTTEMLGADAEIPADPQVVRAVADLWIDYTLLAAAVAEDSSLAALDLESFVQPVREQALVMKLRTKVIQVDTVFDNATIEQRWATEGPGAEIRARHILLSTATNATPAQRDSVRALAEALRGRAAGGESFANLATQYSQDTGSAAQGGDLGFFSRGRMVEQFEAAAFALEPGQLSQVVETPFGYHVIRVEERRQPALAAEERESFRQYLVQNAVQTSEMAYLDSLSTEAGVEVQEGALELVKEIAAAPNVNLRGRAARRAIAEYEGGEFTALEFRDFIRSQPAQVQGAFGSAPDEQIEGGITQLVQMELLLAEAEEQGMSLTAEEETQIQNEARQAIRELVEATGFGEAARAGATEAQLDQHVMSILQGVIGGQAPYVPLGRLGFVLRELYDYEINDSAVGEVVTQLTAIRASQPQPNIPQMDPSMMDPSMMDPGMMDPNMAPPAGAQPGGAGQGAPPAGVAPQAAPPPAQ